MRSIVMLRIGAVIALVTINIVLLGTLGTELRPWRAAEAWLVAAVIFGIIGGVATVRPQRPFSAAWLVGLVLFEAVMVCARFGLPTVDGLMRTRAKNLPDIEGALSLPSGKTSIGQIARHFRERPAHSFESYAYLSYSWFPDPYSRGAADQVMANEFQFINYPPALLGSNLSWKEDPYRDGSWHWILHTMTYVFPLVNAYAASGDAKYLRRAEDLIFDWIDDNSVYSGHPPSPMAWSDHGVAYRTLVWVFFWNLWVGTELASDREIVRLLSAIIAHCRYLADPSFYDINHGPQMDMALLVAASYFPEAVEASRWREIGARRLSERLTETISEAGVYRKHSAGYHLSATVQFTQFLDFACAEKLREYCTDSLKSKLVRMAENAGFFVTPAGKLAAIGDTDRDDAFLGRSSVSDPTSRLDRVLQRYAGRNAALRADLEIRAPGTAIIRQRVLKEDGYAFVKRLGSRPDLSGSFHFAFAAASNPGQTHKHSDDLSFVVEYAGQEILIDPGRYRYVDDAIRRHATSAGAHNSVIADQMPDTSVYRRGDGTARIEDAVTESGWMLVRGSTDAWPGIRHVRTVLLLGAGRLAIIDEVARVPGATNSNATTVSQMWHFGPAVEVVADASSSTVIGTTSSGIKISIEQRPVGSRTVELDNAADGSFYSGIYSPTYGKADRVPAAKFDAHEMPARFLTWITITGDAELDTWTDDAGRNASAVADAGGVKLTWSSNGRLCAATVPWMKSSELPPLGEGRCR
jgi:hypothetical protein